MIGEQGEEGCGCSPSETIWGNLNGKFFQLPPNRICLPECQTTCHNGKDLWIREKNAVNFRFWTEQTIGYCDKLSPSGSLWSACCRRDIGFWVWLIVEWIRMATSRSLLTWKDAAEWACTGIGDAIDDATTAGRWGTRQQAMSLFLGFRGGNISIKIF